METVRLRQRIEKVMLGLAAPTGRVGYPQVVVAVEMIIQDGCVTSTTRTLYERVAAECDTKPARIERNVREEIKAIWAYGNHARLDQMFYNRSKYPPGNKEFLYTLARHLQQEL